MRDLMIIAPGRVTMAELAKRFGDLDSRYEVIVDRRWHTRRMPTAKVPTSERRQAERRQADVNEWLRRQGWAVIPAEQRGPA